MDIKALAKEYFVINPNSDKFYFFLNWLVDEKDFSGKEIIDVMYASHKYTDKMNEYLKWEDNNGH